MATKFLTDKDKVVRYDGQEYTEQEKAKIRKILGTLSREEIRKMFVPYVSEVTKEYVSGYLDSTDMLVESTMYSQRTNLIPVTPGMQFKYFGCSYKDHCGIYWYKFDEIDPVPSGDTGVILKQSLLATEEYIYELRLRYKWISGNVKTRVGIYFYKDTYDEDNCLAANTLDITDKSGDFIEINIREAAPEGANIVQVKISAPYTGGESKYQIEDVSLIERANSFIFRETFENFYPDATGKPDVNRGPIGWTDSDPDNSSAIRCYSGYYQGTYSMFFQSAGAWAKSPEFDIVAGNTYITEIWTQNQGGKGTMKIVFLGNGNELGSQEIDIATGKAYDGTKTANWYLDTIEAVAPAGATSAYIMINCNGSAIGIDNLSVRESSEDHSHNILKNGDFSDDTAYWDVIIQPSYLIEVDEGVLSVLKENNIFRYDHNNSSSSAATRTVTVPEGVTHVRFTSLNTSNFNGVSMTLTYLGLELNLV